MKFLNRNSFYFSVLSLFIGTTSMAQVMVAPAGQNIVSVANVRPGVQMEGVAAMNAYGFEMNNIKQEDLRSKEISQEIAMPKSGEIYIENASRAIQIKTWDQQKVKIVTTAYFEKESTLTDAEWFEKMAISLKALGTSVKIKSGSSSFGAYSYSQGGTVVTGFAASPNMRATNGTLQLRTATKRTMTIYVPAGSKLDIETRYSDVQLPSGIGDVLLDITNGNLEAENLDKLRLRSKYSNANVRDIKEAEIEFANGRFTANNIDDLDIDSKYSTIEMASAKKIKMISTNDEFEVEDVADLRGRKNYGNLRITRLTGSLEVDGSNADIKIRNVGSNVKSIKVDNRYADIRIPLRDTKNYTVDFLGGYSTVYADFEKKALELTEADQKALSTGAVSVLRATNVINNNGVTQITTPSKVTGTISGGTFSGTLAPSAGTISARTVPMGGGMSYNRSGSNTPVKFTSTIGDGKGLKIDIKCQNCTVDFK